MASYLIPYLDPKKNDGEEDPLFSEYTYGDKKQRGKTLRDNVRKGDYLFFHTSSQNKRFITAFYEVEELMDIKQAKADIIIKMKYRNPHLLSIESEENEVIVFGNPVRSLVLNPPLEIDKNLLKELSISFNPSKNQTNLQAISSKLRSWLKLESKQIEQLLKIIYEIQTKDFLTKQQLSIEEIRQISESDIEQFIFDNPSELKNGLICLNRQYQFKDGKRLDLLLEDHNTNKIFIVEIKKGYIGAEVIKQIKGYISNYEKEKNIIGVKGIIVCQGILPHFENYVMDQLLKEKIEIYQYGWMFSMKKL